MGQLTLFARIEEVTQPVRDDIDRVALANLAFLYTATENGNHSGIRFMMDLDHARMWCSSDISRGFVHGVQWAYFFTSVANFIDCYWLGENPVVDLKNCVDDLSWDDRINTMGLVKIPLWNFEATLKPLGVEVINEPSEVLSKIISQDKRRKMVEQESE